MGLYQAGLDIRANQRYWIQCPDGTFVIPKGVNFPLNISNGEKIKPTKDDGIWKWIFEKYLAELENGNIINSVNYPNCNMGICSQSGRIAIFHKNIANMITKFTAIIGDAGINIATLLNKSKGEYAYTLIDIENPINKEIADSLQDIDGVFRVRIIK